MSSKEGTNRLVARGVGTILPPVALVAINFVRWWGFYHPQTSFDLGTKIGVPFGFWQTEKFAGGNEILWPGLLADLAACVFIGVTGYLIADRAYTWAVHGQWPPQTSGAMGGGQAIKDTGMHMDQQAPRRQTTTWSKLSAILVVLLLLCAGILSYKVIDQSLTISYMEDGLQSLEEDNATLRSLIPYLARGETKADVLVLLRQADPEEFIAQTDSTITAGQNVFVFDRAGKLIRLEDLSIPQR